MHSSHIFCEQMYVHGSALTTFETMDLTFTVNTTLVLTWQSAISSRNVKSQARAKRLNSMNHFRSLNFGIYQNINEKKGIKTKKLRDN